MSLLKKQKLWLPYLWVVKARVKAILSTAIEKTTNNPYLNSNFISPSDFKSTLTRVCLAALVFRYEYRRLGRTTAEVWAIYRWRCWIHSSTALKRLAAGIISFFQLLIVINIIVLKGSTVSKFVWSSFSTARNAWVQQVEMKWPVGWELYRSWQVRNRYLRRF